MEKSKRGWVVYEVGGAAFFLLIYLFLRSRGIDFASRFALGAFLAYQGVLMLVYLIYRNK